MDDIIVKIVVALLACAWLGEVAKGLFQKRKVDSSAGKDDADGAQIIVNSAKVLLEPLNQKIREAEVEIATLRTALRSAENQVTSLQAKVVMMTNQLDASTAENKRVVRENVRLRQLLAGEASG